jgi:hypothetical protein
MIGLDANIAVRYLYHEIFQDSRHAGKHLPGTPQMQRLLMRARSAHVFNHEATIERLRKPLLREGSLQEQFEDMSAMAYFLLNQSVIESALKIVPVLRFLRRGDTLCRKSIPFHPPELDPVKIEWTFVEVWIDPMPSPPCILLLLGDPVGSSRVHDPAEDYKVVFSSATNDEAQIWLLEDEYEPVAGWLRLQSCGQGNRVS